MLTRHFAASLIVLALSSNVVLAKGGHGQGQGQRGPGATQGTASNQMMPHRQPELASTLDANGDGRVTWSEIKTVRTAEFTALDSNADGYASFQELLTGQEKQQTQAFETLDADKTGTLSVAEFAGTDSDGKTALNTKVFGLADTDRDGVLSAAEHAALEPVFPHAVRMFSMMDEDDDNQVSRDEYLIPPTAPRLMGDRHGTRL